MVTALHTYRDDRGRRPAPNRPYKPSWSFLTAPRCSAPLGFVRHKSTCAAARSARTHAQNTLLLEVIGVEAEVTRFDEFRVFGAESVLGDVRRFY